MQWEAKDRHADDIRKDVELASIETDKILADQAELDIRIKASRTPGASAHVLGAETKSKRITVSASFCQFFRPAGGPRGQPWLQRGKHHQQHPVAVQAAVQAGAGQPASHCGCPALCRLQRGPCELSRKPWHAACVKRWVREGGI